MSARDDAIDELCRCFPALARGDAGALVDRFTTCAAVEAGARVAEALVEPLAVAVRKHSEGIVGLLGRAHRELCGEVTPPPTE